MKELELLSSLKEVPLDCTDPENAVTALRFAVSLGADSVYRCNEWKPKVLLCFFVQREVLP